MASIWYLYFPLGAYQLTGCWTAGNGVGGTCELRGLAGSAAEGDAVADLAWLVCDSHSCQLMSCV